MHFAKSSLSNFGPTAVKNYYIWNFTCLMGHICHLLPKRPYITNQNSANPLSTVNYVASDVDSDSDESEYMTEDEDD